MRRLRTGVVERRAPPCRDDAGDRRPVGILVAGLLLRVAEEVLAHRHPGEYRVPRIDPGVYQTDRLAAAGFPADLALQLELGVGNIGPDRRQAPLILELVRIAVRDGDRPARHFVTLGREAPDDGLDAYR